MFYRSMRKPLFTLSLCTLSVVAHAGDSNLYDLALEDLLKLKVTGVSLREQTLDETPASINVFDHDSIARLGVSAIVDLIPYVPGFQVFRSDDGNQPTIGVRGRAAGTTGREVLLIVDGVRMNEWWNGGSVFSFARMPLIGVDRIEFIRGPVSHLYGSNAFLGVINVVTHADKTAVKMAAGSHLNHELAGTWVAEFAGATHQVNFEFYDDKGQSYTVLDPFKDIDSQTYREIKDPLKKEYLSYSFRADSWRANVSYHRAKFDDFYFVGGIDDDYSGSDYKALTSSLHKTHNWSDSATLDASIGQKITNRTSDITLIGEGSLLAVSNPPSDEALHGYFDIKGVERWLDIKNLIQLNEQVNFQFGYEYRFNSLEDVYIHTNFNLLQAVTGELPIDYSRNFETKTLIADIENEHSHGVFSQLSYKANKGELSIGLRYDDSELAGKNVSPRISYVHEFNDEHHLKLIYGEAFRAPSAIEYFTINNPSVLGNSELQAETVESIEAIWFIQQAKAQWQISLFHNHFDSSIDLAVNNGVEQFVNVGTSNAQGAEISVSYAMSPDWVMRFNGSHLFDKPGGMFRLADNTYHASLNYAKAAWNINLDYELIGNRHYLNDSDTKLTKIESYGLLNLFTAYSINKNWRIFSAIKNGLDKDYGHPPSGSSKQVIPARGREFKLGVEVFF